jgi:uncharacterized membrane protein YfcA
MDLDPAFFAVALPAVIFAGLSKGGFGAGAGFASTPILALVLPPAQAVGLMLPIFMLMDLAGLRAYWRQWSWPEARALMIGGIPGVALGWLLFRSVSPDGIRLTVGGIAVGFVGFQAARARGWLRPRPNSAPVAAGLFWGAVSGFVSFIAHAGGPPASMYLLARPLAKTTFQATTVIAFWWVNLLKFPLYLALGMFDAGTFRALLILAPLSLASVAAGVWAHRSMSDLWFFRLTYALLLCTGIKLILDALG